MSHQVVQVKRDTVAPCITCPICAKLLRDATTIIECLHTFCRKCIYKKLSDEEMECCPVCNTILGCVPLDKLRPDHNLQDLRAKIFPSKRVKAKTPEPEAVDSSVTLPPTKRKERSLSQLAVDAPRVAAQNGMTGRRSKSSARKASRGSSSFTLEKPAKREDDDSTEDQIDSPSSAETLTKFTQTLKQDSAASDPYGNLTPEEDKENVSERWDGKVDLWKSLNCLVEAANSSKSSKLGIQGPVSKSESLASHEINGLTTSKSRSKDLVKHKSKAQDERSTDDHNTPTDQERPKNSRRVKRARNFSEFRVSSQDLIDASSSKYDRKNLPVWFSLVASDEQNGDLPPLPQIASSYLRIKDGSIPVSYVQKYLKIKLDLTSEDEVEIKCMGETVIPTLSLNNLVDRWLQTTASERVSTRIGSSAKDFVMVLGYARRSNIQGHP